MFPLKRCEDRTGQPRSSHRHPEVLKRCFMASPCPQEGISTGWGLYIRQRGKNVSRISCRISPAPRHTRAGAGPGCAHPLVSPHFRLVERGRLRAGRQLQLLQPLESLLLVLLLPGERESPIHAKTTRGDAELSWDGKPSFEDSRQLSGGGFMADLRIALASFGYFPSMSSLEKVRVKIWGDRR